MNIVFEIVLQTEHLGCHSNRGTYCLLFIYLSDSAKGTFFRASKKDIVFLMYFSDNF